MRGEPGNEVTITGSAVKGLAIMFLTHYPLSDLSKRYCAVQPPNRSAVTSCSALDLQYHENQTPRKESMPLAITLY